MGYYDIGQICLSGHIINGSYNEFPEYSKEYCPKCGEKTIICCPKCNNYIQGDHHNFYSAISNPPAFCPYCGEPYPWTKEKLDSTNELLSLESALSQEELDYFKQNLNSVLIDTPKTKLVATKLKLAINKTSSVVGSALRDILVDIASETAKKIIFPE